MFKKICLIIITATLFLPIFIKPAIVYAAPLIADNESDEAQVMPSSTISLLSLKATVDVGINNSDVSLQYVIKNNGDKPVHIAMGYLENVAKVYDFSRGKDIYINGQLPKGNQVVKLGTGEYTGLRWMTWPVDIKANQTLVIKGTLSLHNKLLNDGTQVMDFPLKSMALWDGPVKQIEVTFRFPQPMIYAMDPTPQPTPTKISDDGNLVWRYSDVEPSEDIIVHFKPTEFIATERLRLSGNKQLQSIAQFYNNDDYVNVINAGERYLSAKPSAQYEPLVQLLLARSYTELLQSDKAIELYNRLLSNNKLGDLAVTVKQQALFYKYTAAQQQNDVAEQQDVLDRIESLDDEESTPAFKSWAAEQKINIQAAAIVKEAEKKAAEQAAQKATQRERFSLDRPINIGGYNIALKYILAAALIIIIVIITLILRSKRKNRRKRMPRW
ncbi:MAG: hypothetical protein PWP55_598 [Clostridiales bacterium]|jgi:tetratricopeptide (TPR) repeat protein|nr:hypothetical protein [Clostridiales bacterium]